MIGHRVIQIHEVDSTNNYAAKLLSEGKLTHGTVILAEYQTAGKGQRGNSWLTTGVKQFTGSYFLKTDFLSVEHLCYLNMCVALSVREVLAQLVAATCEIKWPNDIFLNNQKVAGILVESNWKNGRVEGVIVGIGININPVFHVKHAISLKEIIGKELDPLLVHELLSTSLQGYFDILRAVDYQRIQEDFESHLWKKDQRIKMIDKTSMMEFEGIIRGVDPIGNVLIESEGVVSVFHNQEIDFSSNYTERDS